MKKNQTYQDIIKDELSVRQKKNARYSLRSFARDLAISPARLSEILNKKQGLSKAYAEGIAQKLGFTSEQSDYFCTLVESSHSRSKTQRLAARQRIRVLLKTPFQEITQDKFAVVSSWEHLAILEALNLKDAQPEVAWLAQKLGLPLQSVQQSVDRLLRVGLLVCVAGRVKPSQQHTFSGGSVPSFYVRSFHAGILQMATAALEKQSVSTRTNNSVIFAFDRSRLEEASRRLDDFWRGFAAEFGSPANATEVFCLGLQFFKLTEDV